MPDFAVKEVETVLSLMLSEEEKMNMLPRLCEALGINSSKIIEEKGTDTADIDNESKIISDNHNDKVIELNSSNTIKENKNTNTVDNDYESEMISDNHDEVFELNSANTIEEKNTNTVYKDDTFIQINNDDEDELCEALGIKSSDTMGVKNTRNFDKASESGIICHNHDDGLEINSSNRKGLEYLENIEEEEDTFDFYEAFESERRGQLEEIYATGLKSQMDYENLNEFGAHWATKIVTAVKAKNIDVKGQIRDLELKIIQKPLLKSEDKNNKKILRQISLLEAIGDLVDGKAYTSRDVENRYGISYRVLEKFVFNNRDIGQFFQGKQNQFLTREEEKAISERALKLYKDGETLTPKKLMNIIYDVSQKLVNRDFVRRFAARNNLTRFLRHIIVKAKKYGCYRTQ